MLLLLLLSSFFFIFESNFALNTHHKRVTVDHFINITLCFLSILLIVLFSCGVIVVAVTVAVCGGFAHLFLSSLSFFFYISLSFGYYSTAVRLHVFTLCFRYGMSAYMICK